MNLFQMLENAHETYEACLLAEVKAARDLQNFKACIAEREEYLLANLEPAQNDRQHKQMLAQAFADDDRLLHLRTCLNTALHSQLTAEAERKAAYDWCLMVRSFVDATELQYKDQVIMFTETKE